MLHWSSLISRLLALVQGAPCGWGINPVSPYLEVCLVNFQPFAPENLQGVDDLFNEAHQAVPLLSP